MKRRLLQGFKGGKCWMVGKSATVAFGRGVAECLNTFLRHSFFHIPEYSRSEKFVGLSFLKGGGTRNGVRGFLKMRSWVKEHFYPIYKRIDYEIRVRIYHHRTDY